MKFGVICGSYLTDDPQVLQLDVEVKPNQVEMWFLELTPRQKAQLLSQLQKEA